MSGKEQNLIPELVAAIKGVKLPSEIWRTCWSSAASSQLNAASANQPLDALAVAYILDEPGAADAVRLFFLTAREAWMGDEEDSTVYGEMHLLAVCGVAEHAAGKDLDIATDALSWCAFWFGLGEACRDPESGTLLAVGDRSGDRAPAGDQCWRGWIRALAASEDLAPWESMGHQFGLGMGQSWITQGFQPLQGTLAKAWSLRTTDGWGLLDPIHILRWPDGSVVVYKAKSNNPNTPALLCSAVFYGSGSAVFAYLPPDGGARVRSAADQATCVLVGESRLVYDSATLGHHEIELQAGTPSEVIIGRSAAGVSPVAAQSPAAPPDGGPASGDGFYRQFRRHFEGAE